MYEFLETLKGEYIRIGLKINVKGAKSLRLGINDNEEVMFGHENINQLGSFTYLGSINDKDNSCSEYVKNSIPSFHGVFYG